MYSMLFKLKVYHVPCTGKNAVNVIVNRCESLSKCFQTNCILFSEQVPTFRFVLAITWLHCTKINLIGISMCCTFLRNNTNVFLVHFIDDFFPRLSSVLFSSYFSNVQTLSSCLNSVLLTTLLAETRNDEGVRKGISYPRVPNTDGLTDFYRVCRFPHCFLSLESQVVLQIVYGPS